MFHPMAGLKGVTGVASTLFGFNFFGGWGGGGGGQKWIGFGGGVRFGSSKVQNWVVFPSLKIFWINNCHLKILTGLLGLLLTNSRILQIDHVDILL